MCPAWQSDQLCPLSLSLGRLWASLALEVGNGSGRGLQAVPEPVAGERTGPSSGQGQGTVCVRVAPGLCVPLLSDFMLLFSLVNCYTASLRGLEILCCKEKKNRMCAGLATFCLLLGRPG